MLNVKKLLTKLVNSSNFIVETKNFADVSTAQNAQNTRTLNVSKSGYKPIGTVGFRLTHGWCQLIECRIDNNILTFAVRNNGTTTANVGGTIYVLYQKLGGVLNNIVSAIAHFCERGCAVC